MDAESVPLGMFTVVCDGSACGSGRVDTHEHPPQDGGTSLGRIRVVDGHRSWA